MSGQLLLVAHLVAHLLVGLAVAALSRLLEPGGQLRRAGTAVALGAAGSLSGALAADLVGGALPAVLAAPLAAVVAVSTAEGLRQRRCGRAPAVAGRRLAHPTRTRTAG